MIQTKGWSSFYNGGRGAMLKKSVCRILRSPMDCAAINARTSAEGDYQERFLTNTRGGTATMEMAWFETTGLVNGYASMVKAASKI